MSDADVRSAERIRWLFAQKELACSRYERALARTLGLTEQELRALVVIARHGEISLTVLRLRVGGLSAQAASAVATRLERHDLVERRRDRDDRRRVLLRLTGEAEAVLQVGFAGLAARLDRVFLGLPEDQRTVVATFLARIADASAEAAAEAETFPPAPAGADSVRAARRRHG